MGSEMCIRDRLAGSIGNSKLSNSTVSYGGISLSLGGTDATPAFDLSDATNYPTSSLSGTITNAQLAGSIADSKLSTISTANKISLSALNIDGATDIGAALADADLFIVDDGAGGTNRKITASDVYKRQEQMLLQRSIFLMLQTILLQV